MQWGLSWWVNDVQNFNKEFYFNIKLLARSYTKYCEAYPARSGETLAYG